MGPVLTSPPPDKWGKAAGSERSALAGSNRRYDLDSTVRIFRELRAHGALHLPDLSADVDPELLATREAPADVERLLSEPLQATHEHEATLDDSGAVSVLRTLSLDDPTTTEESQPSAPPDLAAPASPEHVSTEAAHTDSTAGQGSASQADTGEERLWEYQDPSGNLQVPCYRRLPWHIRNKALQRHALTLLLMICTGAILSGRHIGLVRGKVLQH